VYTCVTLNLPIVYFFLNLHHGIDMSQYIICQSFKKFHSAVFSIAHHPICNTKVVLSDLHFWSFHCIARDYLQTGYSDMLDISYLFNNTLKCIKPEIFPLKNRHIDIIAPNDTNFYRLNFKIFKFCFSWMAPIKKMKLSRKVITHPSFTTGAHHLKEVNNTGEWLFVFFWCFFV
jgi:hypothetical protein